MEPNPSFKPPTHAIHATLENEYREGFDLFLWQLDWVLNISRGEAIARKCGDHQYRAMRYRALTIE
jgi:hypothetical protein